MGRSQSHSGVQVLTARRRTLQSLEHRVLGNKGLFGLPGFLLLGGLILIGFLITYVPSSDELIVDPVWSNFGGILLAALTGLLVLFNGLKIRADGRVLSMLGLLFVFAIASSLNEPDRVRYLAVPFAFLLLSSVLFACYLGTKWGEPDKVCMSFWVIFATVSLAAAGVAQLTGGVHVMGINIEPQLLRWAGWFGNANRFGPALAIGVLAAFSLAARAGSRAVSTLMVLIGILLIGGVVSSGSRSTLLALVVGLGILLWMQTRKAATKILMVAAAVLAVIAVILVTPQEVFEVYTRGNSNELRISFIKKGLEMFTSGSALEVIFGHGYGEFQRVVGYSTHNGYLRLILEFGLIFILGMMGFLALLLTRVRTLGVRSEKFKAFVLAILAFILVREIGSPAMIGVRMESLAFAFVIGALAAQPRRLMKLEVRVMKLEVHDNPGHSGRSGWVSS